MQYFQPQRDASGRVLTYQERAALRREKEALAPKEQRGPITRPDMSYGDRAALRRAADRGKREGEVRAAQTESARKAAVLAATPATFRRPANVWRDLEAVWESQAYRPEIARKLADYRDRAEKEDARIDAEMAEKQRRFDVESNPETALCRAHLASASLGADTPEEKEAWARLAGLVEGGASAEYWDGSARLCAIRLEKSQAALAQHTAASAEQAAVTAAAQAAVDQAAKLVK